MAALSVLLLVVCLLQYQPQPESADSDEPGSSAVSSSGDSTSPVRTLLKEGAPSTGSSPAKRFSPPGAGLGGFPGSAKWEKARVVASDISLPYFNKRKKLEILTNRIAVYSADNESAIPAIQALEQTGIRKEDAAAHPIAGWTIAQTLNALGENDGPDAVGRISNLVERLSSDTTAAAFSSPVFRDPELGGLLVATPVVLLGFHRDVTPEERLKVLDAVPGIESALEDPNIDVSASYLKIPVKTARNAFQVFDIVNALAAQTSVLFAEPDMIFEGVGQLIPNDPEFNVCWGLRNTGQSGGDVDFDMDAEEAWDITTGIPSVKVLIIDTGVQQNHPDINQITGKDFTSESASSPDGGPVNQWDRHGTPVAGAVSATINNSLGSVGVAPGVKSVSARCFISSNSSGNWTGSYSWTADALNWAMDQGIRVTNNSNGYGGTSAAVEAAYLNTRNNGAIHFASAGNNGSSSMGYPANVSSVHGIAASNRYGERTSFSQYGTGLAFTAPGESIRLPDRTGTDGYNSTDLTTINGTSFASPYTAGVAALVLSVAPGLTSAEVETIMETTCVDMGTPGYDTSYGWGHVNAFAAVTAALPFNDDSYEENDTRAAAYDLTSNVWQWLESVSGLATQDDDDWFQINAPAGSERITIECSFTHSGGDINISLHDNSGAIIATSATDTDDESIDLVVPSSGVHFIRVYGDDSRNSYDLRWRHRAPPYLTLDSSESTLPPDSGSTSFAVSSNESWSWSFSGGAGWLFSAEATPQNGDQTFGFSVTANPSVTPRSAVITLQNNFQTLTHTVNQEGVPPTLDLDDTEQSFSQSGGVHQIAVTSNTSWTWTITAGEGQINTTEAPSQSGDQTFSYSLPANTGITPRAIVIEFTNGTQTKVHSISQAGMPPEPVEDLTTSELPDEGVLLAWSAAEFATEYQIWRGAAATFNSMTLLSTTSETTYTDSSIASGDVYFYRIVASNINADSAASTESDGKLFGNLDALVRRPKRSTQYGDNIYNTLSGQSVSYKTKKKGTSRYYVTLQNESESGSEIVAAASGKGNRKFKVKYTSSYASGANVTGTMTTGRFLARSHVDSSEVISVSVKPKRKIRKKRGSISLLARTWFHERPDTTDLVRMKHKKKK